MKISTKTRYGLRAVVNIARRDEEFVKSESLAEDENISKKYLDNILGELRKKGLLSTQRGGQGGYSLKRKAETITVADVIEALEGSLAFVPCLDVCEPCERERGCPTQKVWSKIGLVLKKTLSEITIDAIAKGNC